MTERPKGLIDVAQLLYPNNPASHGIGLLSQRPADTNPAVHGLGLLNSSQIPINPAIHGLGLLNSMPTKPPSPNLGMLARPLGLADTGGELWKYVTARFSAFQSNLTLTDKQIEDAFKKFKGLTSSLNSAYRGHNSETDNAFLIGSWAKDTHTRPPRDVDMYYVLPPEVYYRYEGYAASTNKQSGLLQEVKAKLQAAYPTSVITGDGPVVVVDFWTWRVELVPAFYLEGTDRNFLVCNTKNGGRYMKTMPRHQVDAIEVAEKRVNNNVRPLIRMLKCWQAYCNVPIASFYLELLAVEFLDAWEHKHEGLFYYDWMCRDFFKWMITKADAVLFTPGTFDLQWVGNAWKSRAETAYGRAVKAAEHERESRMIDAGDEWQKIFGIDIPRIV